MDGPRDGSSGLPGSFRLDSFLQDVLFGARLLRKSPGFTLVAVLTLALGIGANTAVFSVIERVLLRPLPYPHPEQLVSISTSYPPTFSRLSLSPGDYQDWKREARSFSAMGAYTEIPQGFNLTGQGHPQRVVGAYATASLFPTLGVAPLLGRTFVENEDKPSGPLSVLLTEHIWRTRFSSDPAVVGRSIVLDGRGFTVVGILPDDAHILAGPEVWLPMGQAPDDLNEHIHHGLRTFARLRPEVTLAAARAEVENLHRRETQAYPDSHRNWTIETEQLQDPAARQLRRSLWVLFGAVGLVLLIATSNITFLLLARNAAREKEIALRTALGAGPGRLVRQLLTESVLLAACGGAAGLFLAVVGTRVLSALVPPRLAVVQEVSLDGSILAFTAAVCLAAGVLCGLLPALQARAVRLAAFLNPGGKGGSVMGRHRIHHALVVAEIALALIPLAGAGLLLRSLQHVLAVDPGFRAGGLLTMEIAQAALPYAETQKMTPEQQADLARKQSIEFEQIAERIGALPGVVAAGGVSTLPVQSELRQASRFLVEGQTIPPTGIRPVAQIRTASLGYFAAAGIPLLRGRTFTADDWQVQNIVISQSMARRFWAGGEPLGARVNFCSLDPKPCWFSIVGVVGDVRQMGLETPATYDAYFAGGWTDNLLIRTAGDPHLLAAAAAEIIRKSDPLLPVARVLTMEEVLSDSVAARRFSAVLIGIFAALALLLAAVGTYGVMNTTVRYRTGEIAIRMALGAQPAEVLRSVVGQGARLALAGVAAGTACALLLSPLLSTLLYGVRPRDPATLGGVAALLAAVALAACYIPARRAMRVDPMTALRNE